MLPREGLKSRSRQGIRRCRQRAAVMLFYNNVAELRQFLGGSALKIHYSDLNSDLTSEQTTELRS
jgi:hypothetical protein